MRNPRLQVILIKEIEVCTDHMRECFCALCIVDWLAEKADVVMAQDIVSSRLVEVLILCRGVQPVLLPERVGQCWIAESCLTVS